ncbi:MAG TPA: uroporphyrinogen-III synthase [Nitrososphaeraceae archaeon]|nr:uroporphyrinogen-III synthase [Nitrososphaeraceae archaeon]
MGKTLINKIIAITRNKSSNTEFIRLVRQEGGIPISLPTIKLIPIDSKQFLEKFTQICSKHYHYYVFMSPNSVDLFFKLVKDNNLTHLLQEQLAKCDVIAIGPSTRKKLESNNVSVKWQPNDYSTRGVLKLLKKLQLKPGTRILIPRSGASNSFLKDELDSMSIILDEFYIYYPQAETSNQTWIEFSQQIRMNKVHAIIFTSPSAVRYFFSIMHEVLPDFMHYAKNIVLISIGPSTTNELETKDIVPAESEEHTINGTLRLANRILSQN